MCLCMCVCVPVHVHVYADILTYVLPWRHTQHTKTTRHCYTATVSTLARLSVSRFMSSTCLHSRPPLCNDCVILHCLGSYAGIILPFYVVVCWENITYLPITPRQEPRHKRQRAPRATMHATTEQIPGRKMQPHLWNSPQNLGHEQREFITAGFGLTATTVTTSAFWEHRSDNVKEPGRNRKKERV